MENTPIIRYSASIRTLIEQKKVYGILGLMFVLSFLFASTRKYTAVRQLLEYCSFVYPVVILSSLFSFIPKFNYVEIRSEGLRIARIGFKHKFIKWKEIENIKRLNLYGQESIGIIVKPAYRNLLPRSIFLRKHFGCDIMTINYIRKDGKKLLEDVMLYYDSYSKPI